jgi:hypothetical protein
MPDVWEIANGLNPNDPSDRNGITVRPPFTNLEAFLNGTGRAAGPPSVTALLVKDVAGSTTTILSAGAAYDLVLQADDPGGFAALAFGDVWWSAPGVAEGSIANRGGRYLPGKNYVVSVSLSDRRLWCQETSGSANGWVDDTGKAGLYVDGTRYVVDAAAKQARFRFTAPSAPVGRWRLSAYVQRPPLVGGVLSALYATGFELIQPQDAGTPGDAGIGQSARSGCGCTSSGFDPASILVGLMLCATRRRLRSSRKIGASPDVSKRC